MDILEITNIPYYKKGNTIHIKKENRGKFTKSAKEHDMGVLEFATHVLNNKDKYNPTLIKRANFAKNSKKFKHAKGGLIKKCQNGEILDNLLIYTAGYSDPVTVTANKKLTKKLQMQADKEWREYLKQHPIKIGSEEYNRLPEKAKAQVYKNSVTNAIDRAALPTAIAIIAPTALTAGAASLVGSGALTAAADAAGKVGTKIAGTNLGKAASAFINNPYIDAGLTAIGAYTVPSLYNSGVLNIEEGNYGRALGDFASIGLEGLGAAGTAKNIGNIVLKISPMVKNIYNSRRINNKPLQYYTFIQPPPEHVITFTPSIKSQNRTSYILLERPSKLSEVELQGIPKGKRNNVTKHWEVPVHETLIYKGGAKDQRNFPFSETDLQNASDEVKENMKYSNNKFRSETDNTFYNKDRLWNDPSEELLKFNKDLLEYSKSLPEPDPMFLNEHGFQSKYVQDYRRYLYNLGLDAEDLTNHDIAKILTQLYKDLSNLMTGKTKGMIVWHASPTMFDLFDFSNTGNNYGNMGYAGPGNYFSNARTLSYGMSKNSDIVNILPYLINNIKSTPYVTVMQNKGLIPTYVPPPKDAYEFSKYKNNIKKLVEDIKNINDNKLYIDNLSVKPGGTLSYPNRHVSEFALKRNTGIKSLFPHPSLLIRDNNGKLKIIRNWEDPRVNFKNGGNIFPKRYSNIANRNIKKIKQ